MEMVYNPLTALWLCILFLVAISAHIYLKTVYPRGYYATQPDWIAEVRAITRWQWLTHPLFALNTVATNMFRLRQHPMLRQEFTRATLVTGKATSPSHPDASRARDGGASFMRTVIMTLGLEEYVYQASSNRDAGFPQTRLLVTAKDTSMPPVIQADPQPHQVITMTDVDMYVDMPQFICCHPQAMLLYTIVPRKACDSTDGYSYTFTEDQRFKASITGGARYHHWLWDYGDDTFTATLTLWGIPLLRVFGSVERRDVDHLHQVLLIYPRVAMPVPFCWLPITGPVIKRMEPVSKGFIHLTLFQATGVVHSLGATGQYTAAQLDDASHSALCALRDNSAQPVSPATVLRYAKSLSDQCAAIAAAFYRTPHVDKPVDVFPITISVRKYQSTKHAPYDPECPPSLDGYMPPLIDGAFAPDRCRGSDEWCIQERVTGIANTKPVTSKLANLIREFSLRFVPEQLRGTLHPVDIDEVYARQARPTQRRILDAAEELVDPTGTNPQSFQKAEAYGAIKPPRNITVVCGTAKANYSRYTYSLVDAILHDAPWYAFGHTPAQIANHVAEICAEAEAVICTDFSRFDGTIGATHRALERTILTMAFARAHHEELLRLHETQYAQKARTKFGVKYDTGLSRLSGSPETSAFNSLANAFTLFCAYVRLGMDYDQAYHAIGIVGGDDGLTADLPADVANAAAEEAGLVLKATTIERGHDGVNFLARYYTDEVWTGSPNSCCDIARQVSKLHTTPTLRIPAQEKFLQKMMGYWHSDHATPILGEIIECLEQMGVEYRRPTADFASYNARVYTEEVQYPNHPHPSFVTLCESQLPEFNWEQFSAHLHSARDIKTLMMFPCCYRMPVDKTPETTVNGDIPNPPTPEVPLIVETPPPPPPSPATATTASPPCPQAGPQTKQVGGLRVKRVDRAPPAAKSAPSQKRPRGGRHHRKGGGGKQRSRPIITL